MTKKYNSNDYEKFKEANDPTLFDIKTLELVSSNVCNLLCLPCEAGSYIRNSEFHKMGLQKTIPIRFVFEENELLYDLDFKHLTFYGGEPFADKITFQLIDKLIASGKSKNIRIDLNTNITMVTEEKLLRLKNNFQQFYIRASIDGFHESNYYLRYPCKWNVIEAGVDLMKSLDIDFCVTVALSNLALLTLDKLITWAVKEKQVMDMFFTHVETLRNITTPAVLTYTHLPAEIKQQLLPKFIELSKDTQCNDRVQELISAAIQICNTPGEDIADLITFLDTHDKHRGTDFTKIWPEINNYRK
jgi:sulfatase maturation enzyme AslB (radical SAM superfamily)